jgi:hypothetical protein
MTIILPLGFYGRETWSLALWDKLTEVEDVVVLGCNAVWNQPRR